MLFTTGKNAGMLSKRIARAFSLAIPESRFEARGKRSAAALIAKARKFHFLRFCTLSEENGKPALLSFLSLEKNGEWARLSPTIKIEKVSAILPKFRFQQSRALKISGTKGKMLQQLFAPIATPDEKESEILSSAKKLEIKIGKVKILSLGVEYGQ